MISELNSQACGTSRFIGARPLSTLRRLPYEKPTHDSGPRLVANHYHAGDFHPLLSAGFYRRFRLDRFISGQLVAPESVSDLLSRVLEQVPDVVVHGEVEYLPTLLNEVQGLGY